MLRAQGPWPGFNLFGPYQQSSQSKNGCCGDEIPPILRPFGNPDVSLLHNGCAEELGSYQLLNIG